VPRPTRTFIAHGRRDPIIQVDFGRRARSLLEEAGMDVEYHESDHGHWIEPADAAAAADWFAGIDKL
jgi:phospholipase/carboxylesterase